MANQMCNVIIARSIVTFIMNAKETRCYEQTNAKFSKVIQGLYLLHVMKIRKVLVTLVSR